MRCVVVGAGIAGLATTLALGRAGHAVTLFERDADPGPNEPDEAFDLWHRPGTPQARLAHGFVARSRQVLRERAADVLAAALAAGINELDMKVVLPQGTAPAAGDEDLIALASRRGTFELVLRRIVEREPNVAFEVGVVSGITASNGRPPSVTGVTVGTRHFLADLVVDATGRSSRVLDWLRGIQAQSPVENSAPAAVVYYGRFYRVRRGERLPEGRWIYGPRGDAGYMGFIVHRADGDVFSLTFWTPPGDDDLKALRHEAVLEAAVAAVPLFAPWREVAEPISTPVVYGSASNRHRRFVKDGVPLARHFAVVGDSRCHTDPADGLGASVALVHAFALADATRRHNNVDDAVLDYDAETEPLTREVYDSVVDADRVRRLRFAGESGSADDVGWILTQVLPAAGSRDPEIMRGFLRRASILDLPSRLAGRQDLLERASAIFAQLGQTPRRPVAPPRDEFVARLRAALPA